MNSKKSLIWTFIALVIIAALYRIVPNRPWGFTPQLAMALFAGAMIRDKKWAFAFPLFSMFISDALYQGLYAAGITPIHGFYDGQIFNYLLVAAITVYGFTMRKVTALNIFAYSVIAPVIFFLISNAGFWLTGGADITTNLPLPKTFDGLMTAFNQGIPFFRGSLYGTVLFSALLFGGYYVVTRKRPEQAAA